MRLLFTLDKKDYDENAPVFSRPSVRAILIRDGKIAMVHSLKYDYYKFPGGGIEPGETQEETLIRETMEEAGLTVDPASIQPYGLVHRVQKDKHGRFIQDNFYYLCRAKDGVSPQKLDDYEAEERFTPCFVTPEEAIRTNLNVPHGPKDPMTMEREARVLKYLMDEGYFD